MLLASGVALTLLLAPDSYAVFGLLFLALTLTLGARLHREARWPSPRAPDVA